MKGQKKKKSVKAVPTEDIDPSIVSEMYPVFEMPTADVVAAERASEAAYERELAALRLPEGSDSSSSDSEALLRGALRPLQQQCTPLRAQPPAAAALVPPLAAALRDAHPHDVRLLDDYAAALQNRSEAEVDAITEELMQSVEEALMAGAAGGVVLAAWLCAAAARWTPRVPRVVPALHGVLQRLSPPQGAELARALHAALQPRELLDVSDAARGGGGGGGGGLSELLLRAALGRLAGAPVEWERGALRAAEVRAALAGRWGALDAAAQLAALDLAGRVLGQAGAAPEDAAALLDALPPPREAHDPDHVKVTVAVKMLRNLFVN